MEFNTKGQLSALVLSTLKKRDMYGLEIIAEVEKDSENEIVIKQPSLYSNLKRMEQQGYITSYWKDSELGGKRHYYSITDLGAKACDDMLTGYQKTKVVVSNFVNGQDANEQERPTLLQQENIFSVLNSNDKKDDAVEIPRNESYNINNLNEINKLNEQFSIFEAIEKPEINQVLGTSLPKPVNGNHENIDIAKEFKNFKKRKSFAENQIKIEVPNKPVKNTEQKKQDIDSIKDAIEIKETLISTYFNKVEKVDQDEKEAKDDAILITEAPDPDLMPKVKKLAPARINIYESERDNLPPPNKNVSLEPTYKDMVGKLYEQSNKDDYSEQAVENYFDDYNELERHYRSQGVDFKAYDKNQTVKKYPTNKLNLIKSILTLTYSTVLSVVIFCILNALKLTTSNTNFLYFIFPTIAICDLAYKVYIFKSTDSKAFKQLYSPIYLILTIILAAGAIIGINLLCGMNFNKILEFATPFILPLCFLSVLILDYLISFYFRKKY